ncbi:hypothetical protein RSP03_00120 [Cereibacter sphaeroides]|nr:hypothetical protein RSP03_00120 [Cereibacter sphaeroides]
MARDIRPGRKGRGEQRVGHGAAAGGIAVSGARDHGEALGLDPDGGAVGRGGQRREEEREEEEEKPSHRCRAAFTI